MIDLLLLQKVCVTDNGPAHKQYLNLICDPYDPILNDCRPPAFTLLLH